MLYLVDLQSGARMVILGRIRALTLLERRLPVEGWGRVSTLFGRQIAVQITPIPGLTQAEAIARYDSQRRRQRVVAMREERRIDKELQLW